ncbi:MAG: sulfatase-like hydrolase/transferase [Endomicrobium sp.]|nr:sulfatase-like hydrolase/transferase [Endomicrobium sp.]
MKNFKTMFFKVISLNFIFLLLMSAYRFIFFVYYGKAVDLHDFGFDIIKAFYMGCRFDLSVIAWINVLPALLFCLLFVIGGQSLFKRLITFLKYYYTVFIGILLALFCIDFYFYAYFQDHLNVLVFGFIEDDTIALIKTFYENYNLLLIGFWIVVFFVIIFFISKIVLKFKDYNLRFPNIFVRILLSIALAFSIFLMIRGSVGLHPIGVYSDISSNAFLNQVAINCVFNLGKAIEYKIEASKLKNIETGYENNIRQAFADFLGKDVGMISEEKPEESLVFKTSVNKKIENLKPNVILIVMESFSDYLIKYNSEKFNVLGSLKKHFDEDTIFHNFSSAGTITIEAIEAMFLNIRTRPNPINLSVSKYAYKQYQFAGLVPYKQSGYETSFIYGGCTSWRNIGTFALNSGFDNALNCGMIKKDSPGGPWGVYDEYLFDLAFEVLSQSDNNKFIYILTTTNHPPYGLPNDYKILPLEIPDSLKRNISISNIKKAQKRFATYQYSNEMLGRFISKIKNSKYGDNTIIAVTGDHTSRTYRIENFLDSICVPFYLYIPKTIKSVNINTDVFGSHLDIMPTLYNLSLSNAEYMSEGTDLLSKNAVNNTISYESWLIDKHHAIDDDIFANSAIKYYYLDTNHKLVPTSEITEHKNLLRRFLSMLAISDYLIKNTGK